jgi:hypothetical protein
MSARLTTSGQGQPERDFQASQAAWLRKREPRGAGSGGKGDGKGVGSIDQNE